MHWYCWWFVQEDRIWDLWHLNREVIYFLILPSMCNICRQLWLSYPIPELMKQKTTDVCGRTFPANIIKIWSDIHIQKEIGKGDFGKVYHGYLHLNEVQRYLYITCLRATPGSKVFICLLDGQLWDGHLSDRQLFYSCFVNLIIF